MAPARMMQFADKHIKNCEICLGDASLMEEIEKIREFVLPESKIPRSERDDEEEETPEISSDDGNGDENDDKFVGDDDDDDDVDIDDED